MNRILCVFTVLVSIAFLSCQGKAPASGEAAAQDKAPAAGTPSKGDVSYALGTLIGQSIKSTSLEVDYGKFLSGIKDVMENKKTTITPEKANEMIQTAVTEAMAKQGERNLAKEAEFLATNGKKAGVTTTASGLQYEVIKEGTGPKPKATDTVKVDYTGTLLDGTKFDSSIDRGEPAEFPLDGVIPGWTEGIQLMNVGSKCKLYVPSKLAYGEQGPGGPIGANATLVFEVELLSIVEQSK